MDMEREGCGCDGSRKSDEVSQAESAAHCERTWQARRPRLHAAAEKFRSKGTVGAGMRATDAEGPITGTLTFKLATFPGGVGKGPAPGYREASHFTDLQPSLGHRRGGFGRDIHSWLHFWQ